MRLLLPCAAALLAACDAATPAPPVSILAAASLARPAAVIADSFRARHRRIARVEPGGSQELARRLTELGRVPDVLLLADDAVMASLLPRHIGWYVRFATSPLVIAYRASSRHAADVTAENWTQVLARPGVRIGRADSAIAPAGRHALLLLRRVDGFHGVAGTTDALLANSPPRLVRPNATELAALLETGVVDYIIDYESVARQYGFRFIELPRSLAPTVVYTASIPRLAQDTAAAMAFMSLLLSDVGKDALRRAEVQSLRVPVAVGDSVPPAITDLVRTLAMASPR